MGHALLTHDDIFGLELQTQKETDTRVGHCNGLSFFVFSAPKSIWRGVLFNLIPISDAECGQR